MDNNTHRSKGSSFTDGEPFSVNGALWAIRKADKSLVTFMIQPIAAAVVIVVVVFFFWFLSTLIWGSKLLLTLQGVRWIDIVGLQSIATSSFYFAVLAIRNWWVVFIPEKKVGLYNLVLKMLEKILLTPILISFAYILFETFSA